MGKANGLTLLLDAETYEYSSHAAGAEGFKVAVDHHLDQPLMSISELDIAPGFESQGRWTRFKSHSKLLQIQYTFPLTHLETWSFIGSDVFYYFTI